jgi:hypothetical protein
MPEAYSYQVINSPQYYFVYTDKVLLGSLEKKYPDHQHVLIEINGQQYKLEVTGTINIVILVINTTINKLVGRIKMSGLGRLFPEVVFEYNNVKLKWINKGIFSLHWQWKKDNDIVIETIENLQFTQQKGVLVLFDYFIDASLLIMIGVYLRNNHRPISLQRFNHYKTKKEITI